MNRIYRLVWNQNRHVWMAVAENAKGRSKSGATRKLIAGVLALVGGALLAPLVLAAPVGGQVSAGAGSIAQAGANTTITQSSQNLAINWQGFGIAANEAVRFNQPNASAIALNRVLGQSPSEILGSLSANGQVFVLNPNGVLFGTTAHVNVGGLVASTLNLSDADFMAGKHSFGNGGAAGSVLNQGTLTAANEGYIALLAPNVRNEGVISATLGTALLAAGDKVTLTLNNGSLLAYRIDQGSLNALAENKQLIQADGGQVFMSAKAANALTTAMVNNTGIIEARTVQNVAGVIKLMGDMQVGQVNVGGTLDASAPNGGDGGFVETSAAHVKVADATQINTAAPQGISGTWLIDPTDYFIGVDISAATLASNLSAGNITIQTIAAGAGNGDIFVNVPVTWSSSNKLTLNAYRDINFNASITNSAGGSLVLRSDMTGTGSGTINNNGASVNLSGGGRADLYYNPTSYVAPTNFASFLGATPYTAWMLVNDATNLQGMSTNLGGAYALGKDIDATATSTWNSGAGFAPVGNSSTPFTGIFDGLNHAITNLTINRPTQNYVGLFGRIGSGSAVRNVGLVGGSVSGTTEVGGLAGVNSGTITNSYSTGSVRSSGNVGGLAGVNSGTITNSYATGSVSVTGAGSNSFGGLVGYNDGTISNSYATGSVSGIYYVGGLVGPNYGGTITNSYATGAVSGVNVVGGLAGDNGYGGTISNSYWDIETSGMATSAGGAGKTTAEMRQQATFSGFDFTNTWWLSPGNTRPFLRSEYSTTITNAHQLQLMAMNLGASYTLGADINMAELTNPSGLWNTTTGFVPIGDGSGGPGVTSSFDGTFDGLGHTISNLTINRTTIDLVGLFGYTGTGSAIRNVGLVGGSVSGISFVGGLVGSNTGTVSNSYYATGSVSGSNNYVGGLVGNNQGTVSSSYATGSVSGGGSVGGLVGHNGGTVSTSYAAGSVIGSGYSVGGLVGSNYGMVSSSYAITGSVSGTNEVGGLVGNNSNGGTVSTSYATGGVNGSGEFVGGLVGSNDSTVGTSYATGDVRGTNYVGGLAGGNGGTVSDSYATGSVIWNGVICCGGTGPDRGGEAFGGLVGYNYGTVSNSYATGGVGGTSYVGGLVGLNEDTVSNSHATGDVNGVASGGVGRGVGGLVGYNGGTVSNSYATGDVIGDSETWYVGGLVGNNYGSAATISNSYATSNVSGRLFLGGLAGFNDGTINDSRATISVTGAGRSGSVGGLVGENYGTISNVYATGSVAVGDVSAYIGGLVGQNFGAISNSYATVSVIGNGSYNLGGLVGLNGSTATISNSYATGNVSGTYYVGGLVGSNDGGTVNNNYATGNVTGDFGVGGLAGLNYGSTATISNSYATGNVSGSDFVGGLVGYNDGTVYNSYATGSVTGVGVSDSLGGLVGINNGDISNSYATGSVSGTSNIGGLIGDNSSGMSVDNSFWDSTVNAVGIGSDATIGDTAGATGMSTAQMMSMSTFSSAGWSISDTGGSGATWRIYEGQTTPWLMWWLKPLTVIANGDSNAYNGAPYSGGNGVTYSVASPDPALSGALAYGGTAQSAANVGSYTISASGLYSVQQGYDISYVNGALTIDRANLTLSGTRVYNGLTAYAGSNLTATGVNGETFAIGGTGNTGNLASANVQTGSTLASLTDLTLGTGSGGGLSSNYNALSTGGSSVNVTAASLTVTADDKSRLYGQANPALTSTVSGFVNGETAGTAAGFTGAGSATTTASATTNVGTAVITAGAGNLAATNYDFTRLVDGTLTINPAPVLVPVPAPAPEIIAPPVSGILPAVVAAIVALPGGAVLLPAFSSTVTVAAALVDANAPPIALSNLQYVYLKATPGTASTNVVSAADAATAPTKSQDTQSDGFNERLVDSPIQFSGTVLVRNGGIKLPRGVEESE